MKLMTLLMTFFISFSTSAYWCGEGKFLFVAWGSVVDVECTETVVFELPVDLKIEDLKIKIEEIGEFECFVETQTNSYGQKQMFVNWTPGSDSSGCIIGLYSKSGLELSTSQLYMSY